MALLLVLACAFATTGCGRGRGTGSYTVKFRSIPPHPETGPVHLVFDVRDASGKPASAKAVDVVASIPPRPPLPEMEIKNPASEEGVGSYGVMMSLAARGTWSVAATVRDGGKVLTSGAFTLDVR